MTARLAAWAVAVALPLAALWLFLARPELDVRWEHHPAHFWLVLAVAAVSAFLAFLTGAAARRHGDARVFLLSLAFVASAGFLGLHALATPGVLLAGRNTGFVIATPVGLVAAAFLAAASAVADLVPGLATAVMRRHRELWWGLILVMAVWATVSLAELPPLRDPLTEGAATKPLIALAAAGVLLYLVSAARYYELYRAQRPLLVAGVATAFALLAEALLAVAFGRSWQASWWEWHALMAAAFVLIFVATRVEYARVGSFEAAFRPLYLGETIERVDRRYAHAVDALVGGAGDDELVERFTLTPEELALVRRTAAWAYRAEPEAYEEGDREVTVLFADLQGFTAYAEEREPPEVLALLNENFEAAVPVVEAAGGRLDKLVGDALMAEFGLAGEPRHAEAGARAALDLQAAAARVAARHAEPAYPRFRVGVNTGRARVGRVGGGLDFTVVGDAVNVASRLEGVARAGEVVIGAATRAALGDGAVVEELEPLAVKGKRAPVRAYVLRALPPDVDERDERLQDQEREPEA